MTLVLLIVGLLATAAGFVTIGFGIPINSFSLGNTLILSGTVAVATGLVLIGLAAVLGQLRRIGEVLNGRALSAGSRSAESVETMLPPTARLTPAAPQAAMPEPPRMPPRMPMPPRPQDIHEPEPLTLPSHMTEPRFPEPAASAPAGPLDWLRAKPRSQSASPPQPIPPQPPMTQPASPEPAFPPASFPQSAHYPSGMMEPPPSEPPMVEVSDEAPLSPRSPQRPAMPPPMPEPAFDPRSWAPPPPARNNPAQQPMQRATPMPIPAAEPAPRDREGFDMVWPEPRPGAPEPAVHEARPEVPPPMPAALRPRDEPQAERRAEPPAPKPAAKPVPERGGPAILKSGVIDGMPYTLYADGSIEAELPQGVVKFASVDALRSHLEKQG